MKNILTVTYTLSNAELGQFKEPKDAILREVNYNMSHKVAELILDKFNPLLLPNTHEGYREFKLQLAVLTPQRYRELLKAERDLKGRLW